MVNRKVGHLISGGATLKVMFQDAQMVCCMRIS